MSFSEKAKLTALAIVHIFETSRPLGDYAAVAVLNDGAGVSYGINQFTHRSGGLHAVVMRYLALGGTVGRTPLTDALPILSDRSERAIAVLAGNRNFKAALKFAAQTEEMRRAQHEIAFKRYLGPAIEACEGSGFTKPLSLAVVYDSINHGSYEKIRDRVTVKRTQFFSDVAFEQAWISEYVQCRDKWLESVPRLKPTAYRTDFFLLQIARGNWDLDLPLNVHGHKLTEQDIAASGTEIRSEAVAGETPAVPSSIQSESQKVIEGENDKSTSNTTPNVPPAGAQPQNESKTTDSDEWSVIGSLEKVGQIVEKFGRPVDKASEIGNSVKRRTDSAKSLWTTILGTLWQTAWAIGAFFIGLPKEVWLTVALVAASLAIFYLYRQISLGKIREQAKPAAGL